MMASVTTEFAESTTQGAAAGPDGSTDANGAAAPSPPFPVSLQGVLDDASAWFAEERAAGTLLGEEILWREAYGRYRRLISDGAFPDGQHAIAWASIALRLVFECPKLPLNQTKAAREAVEAVRSSPGRPFTEQAREVRRIADHWHVERPKLRALLEPGLGYPWAFPRNLWTATVVGRNVYAITSSFDWEPGGEPSLEWIAAEGLSLPVETFLTRLGGGAAEGSDLRRMLDAAASLVARTEEDGRDVSVCEPHSFVNGLQSHGLSVDDGAHLRTDLFALRECLVLVASYQLHQRGERYYRASLEVRDDDPRGAVELLTRAANVYRRLVVAQMYSERVVERYQEICREAERLQADRGLPDDRFDQMLLISTFNSPGDLRRLVLSVAHELMAFGYARRVHLVVSDDSTEEMQAENERVLDEGRRAGLSISHWMSPRKEAFFDRINAELYPDGSFDVRDLLGGRKRGEKGIPYGRFRNFLRLAALHDMRALGLDEPVSTWLDQDNEIGALVLTRAGTLSKRHVFHYFHEKSRIFADGDVLVGGGGYTNDALEGVEKFWVAWGILGQAFALAEEHSPEGPPLLGADIDITRFRPWDQPETLERLPREGEEVETLSDQFLLLLQTLVGAFRGKYDNQVQIYHPWTYGHVVPDEERLTEESRAFAGMPGGNTSFRAGILSSPIPFITVGGRGEDIFHLWQIEGQHGPGTVRLTHTPALHTRNVRAGRSSLMGEIIDSYNGRIFREPPLLWSALAQLADSEADPFDGRDVEMETDAYIATLRAEAKECIGAVAGFARALEPFLDEENNDWWLKRSAEDPRYTALLGTLRELVADFNDADGYDREAEDKLLTPDDVRELTEEFIRSYPHWQNVVDHVAGAPAGGRETGMSAGSVRPLEGYGAPLRQEAGASAGARPRLQLADPPGSVDVAVEPDWHEIVDSSLALFRRYERGRADADHEVSWQDRVERLRAVHRHHATLAGSVPDEAWTTLFRDALFVPGSAPHSAVTALLVGGVLTMGQSPERETAVTRIASDYQVEAAILWDAVGGEVRPE